MPGTSLRVSAPRQEYEVDDETVAVTLQEPDPDVHVPEALVQDLWQHQRFDTSNLTTTDGDPVRIFDPGRQNTDAGPDFLNAHVRIGAMDWRGHVEIHTTSGEWFKHDHNSDSRYDGVILHVALHADIWTGGLLRADESTIPEIVLYPRLDTPLRHLLHAFHTRPDDDSLPCASRWDEVPETKIQEWITTLAAERMTEKRDRLAAWADTSLEERLHERLFAGLGYSKNDEPMSMLAQRLRPTMVRTLKAPRNREALHLGVAGLLPEAEDLLDTDRSTADYAMDLRDRFRRLQVQLEVREMESSAWTFFRLRPNNFPTLRIVQAAAWYANDGLLATDPLPRLRTALTTEDPAGALLDALQATPSSFWMSHYHLTKRTSEYDPSLGTSRRETLLVNAVIPILLLDADRRNDTAQTEAAIEVLRSLSPSRDTVVRTFRKLGTSADTAYEAQGMHQLYREYCTEGGCLDCEIGQYLLNS